MNPVFSRAFVGVLLLGVTNTAFSQVDDHLFRALNNGSYSSIQVSLNGTSGNLEDEYFSVQLNSSHRGDAHSYVINGQLNYSETNGTKTNEAESLKTRYLYSFNKDNAIEIIAEYQRDVLQGLSQEIVYGVGYRWENQRVDEHSITSALGLGFIRSETNNRFSPKEQDYRGNIYGSLNVPFGGNGANASISAIARPNIQDTSDWRLISEITINAPLSENLSANFQVTYNYDKEPENGIESRDLNYSTSLSYQF